MPRGSPGVAREKKLSAEQRFWSHVERRGIGECWLWTGAVRKGYGTFKLGIGDLGATRRQDVYAHRVAFYLEHGRWPVPQGLHGCDNPLCCNAENPEHVHEGTPALNMQEKYERGRAVHPAGEQSVHAALSDSQAAELRARYERGGVSRRALAAEYGVSQITVSRVVRGLRYRGR